MEDEDCKLKKDQGIVGTKKEKMVWLKRKDEDIKSEEDEQSSLKVKEGWQDG
jgi:hypothetical protein